MNDFELAQKRAEELRKIIEHHARLYYIEDSPEISDYEYDKLFYELVVLEEKYPELARDDSPTKRVGGAALDKFEKVTHTVRMGSLSDVFSYEELEDFVEKTAARLGHATLYSVEPKIDGLSVSLEYQNGKLIIGSTRGDGVTGGYYMEDGTLCLDDGSFCFTLDGAGGLGNGRRKYRRLVCAGITDILVCAAVRAGKTLFPLDGTKNIVPAWQNLYRTPNSVIVHKLLLIFLCKMNIIRARTQIEGVLERPAVAAGNKWPVWFQSEGCAPELWPGQCTSNGSRCSDQKERPL